MLSSIHPLGERGRNNRWALTVGAFAVGASAAGSVVGAALGAAGGLAPIGLAQAAWIIAAAALVAAGLDAMHIHPLGIQRQVNERWIGAYRGWVYGGAFGVQLGAGGATYIVTWLVYATAIAAAVSGSAASGALIGLTFGVVRTIPLAAARWIDRPSRLGRFHRTMAALGPQVRVASIAVTTLTAFAAVSWVI